MSEYNVYPAVDINNSFPPPVRAAIAAAAEVTEVVDNAVAAGVATKADAADTYTKLQTNDAISAAVLPKANAADVYTKTESDAKYELKGATSGSDILVIENGAVVPTDTPVGTLIIEKLA